MGLHSNLKSTLQATDFRRVALLLLLIAMGTLLRCERPVSLDLVSAVAGGMVQADVVAQGYQAVEMAVTNRRSAPLMLSIPLGLKLRNSNSEHQDLTVGEDQKVLLQPGETVNITLPTYCISPHRRGPSGADDFEIAGLVSEEVRQVLHSRQPRSVIQLEVWRLIDSERLPTSYRNQGINREFRRRMAGGADLLLVIAIMLGSLGLASLLGAINMGSTPVTARER